MGKIVASCFSVFAISFFALPAVSNKQVLKIIQLINGRTVHVTELVLNIKKIVLNPLMIRPLDRSPT